MKIGFSSFTLINQHQDKPQFLTSARVAPLKVEPAAAPAEDDPFTKRLKKQREALESLASLPTPKEASQQRAAEKVGFLRQRLEMLKTMMRFASPEQLKNMAKELKSIAGQLAGAAKLLGNQGGGSVGITATPSVVQPAAAQQAAAQQTVAPVGSADSAASQTGSDAGSQANIPTDAQLESAEAEAKAAVEEAEKASGTFESVDTSEIGFLTSLPSLTQNEDNRSKSDGPSASENALRGALSDAQKELREAVNELKIRLREEDKEARRELKKAEEDMAKTDRAVAAATSNAMYSSLGQLLPTSLSDVAISTTSINIEV